MVVAMYWFVLLPLSNSVPSENSKAQTCVDGPSATRSLIQVPLPKGGSNAFDGAIDVNAIDVNAMRTSVATADARDNFRRHVFVPQSANGTVLSHDAIIASAMLPSLPRANGHVLSTLDTGNAISHFKHTRVQAVTVLALVFVLLLIGSTVAIGAIMVNKQHAQETENNNAAVASRQGFRQNREEQRESVGQQNAARWGKPSSTTDVPPQPPSNTTALPNRAVSSPSVFLQKRNLCPGLVVPRGNECVLAVPARAAGVGALAVDIREMNGAAMLKAEFAAPNWLAEDSFVPSGQAARATISLRSTHGPKPLIAYCRAIADSSGRRSMYIYDTKDELHAHLTKLPASSSARECYQLTSGRSGVQMLFDGNFGKHVMSVYGEHRSVLADTEPADMKFDPSGAYYRLRVAEKVDVGLIICALLSIDLMEAR